SGPGFAIHASGGGDGRGGRMGAVGGGGTGGRRDRERRGGLLDHEVPRRQPSQGFVIGRVVRNKVRRHRIGPRVRLGGGPAGENILHRARHGTGGNADQGGLARAVVGLRRVSHPQRRRWGGLVHG